MVLNILISYTLSNIMTPQQSVCLSGGEPEKNKHICMIHATAENASYFFTWYYSRLKK